MLRRLTDDGDYLMIDVIGATLASQCRRADITLRSTAYWAGLGWDGDWELTNPIVAVILAPSFGALDQCQIVTGSNHSYCTYPGGGPGEDSPGNCRTHLV